MMQMLEPVHEAVGDAGPAGPGVDGGALLAGPHVAHPALVPQVAHLRLVAARRPVLRQIYFHHWTNIFPCAWSPCSRTGRV